MNNPFWKAQLWFAGLIIACCVFIFMPEPEANVAYRELPVKAKPSGHFITLYNVQVGHNGWSNEFLINGVERKFCEMLPLHNGMILDLLTYEPWLDDAGKEICWSIRNDKAGFIIRRDNHGWPIHTTSFTERARSTQPPVQTAEEARAESR